MWAYELIEGQLKLVSERVRDHGPGSIASIALVRVDTEDEDGAMETVASGADLVALAPQLA